MTRGGTALYRKQVVDGVYRLDEGALLDDFSTSAAAWVVDLLDNVRAHRPARDGPFVQYILPL